LLIAGAGAAGFTAVGAPVVRSLPGDAVSAVLLLDDCHMSVHTFPSYHLLLLDILTLSSHDPQKALDVFTRRLTAREVRCEKRARG
jgi:S-adenosylmethionine/arginine decarboxylase-like enzyme